MSRISVALSLTAAEPANLPPQYSGPSVLADLVIGQGRQLQGFDPDGDQITWEVDPADVGRISVSPSGLLTPLVALSGESVTVWLDDGRP